MSFRIESAFMRMTCNLNFLYIALGKIHIKMGINLVNIHFVYIAVLQILDKVGNYICKSFGISFLFAFMMSVLCILNSIKRILNVGDLITPYFASFSTAKSV